MKSAFQKNSSVTALCTALTSQMNVPVVSVNVNRRKVSCGYSQEQWFSTRVPLATAVGSARRLKELCKKHSAQVSH